MGEEMGKAEAEPREADWFSAFFHPSPGLPWVTSSILLFLKDTAPFACWDNLDSC